MEAKLQKASSLSVRKLEPWVIYTHTRNAENAGISLEEHLRRMLTTQALQAQEDFANIMEQRRAEIVEDFGPNFPSSEEVIQAVRDDSL